MNIAIVLIIALLPTAPPPTTGTLTVEVSGMDRIDGTVRIGLYQGADDFLAPDRVLYGADVRVDARIVRHTFRNLPAGEYAISIFHDENDNGVLDTGWFGIPKEPYGFGNDARGSFGPPDYRDVVLRLSEGESVRTSVRVK